MTLIVSTRERQRTVTGNRIYLSNAQSVWLQLDPGELSTKVVSKSVSYGLQASSVFGGKIGAITYQFYHYICYHDYGDDDDDGGVE